MHVLYKYTAVHIHQVVLLCTHKISLPIAWFWVYEKKKPFIHNMDTPDDRLESDIK